MAAERGRRVSEFLTLFEVEIGALDPPPAFSGGF
jgi:hypothetical protein